ncbi:hypothetical protein PRIPAC_73615 [Pristionchus pacificus]|uniref:Uncharacterized protein n=1 Tax=Pristionchus pacificus TaxID=54126 RepID=A0A2A6C016_PRIPA|nr:hypothetical protein PRIPAC_73615 [Pristionchus pacificus]|eukprot:PDM71525.1 hypothetical protein PRIPAC_37932 [Pristionchus pacificus]
MRPPGTRPAYCWRGTARAAACCMYTPCIPFMPAICTYDYVDYDKRSWLRTSMSMLSSRNASFTCAITSLITLR